jgi:hypothetical protein
MTYYTLRMSMGKRKRERQPVMWITTTDVPTAASGSPLLGAAFRPALDSARVEVVKFFHLRHSSVVPRL